LSGSTSDLPTEGHLTREIQRMLAGLTEFMPVVVSIALLIVARRHASLPRPARLMRASDIPTPPPRRRFMAA
jgi:hypothetical protein